MLRHGVAGGLLVFVDESGGPGEGRGGSGGGGGGGASGWADAFG